MNKLKVRKHNRMQKRDCIGLKENKCFYKDKFDAIQLRTKELHMHNDLRERID